MGEAPEGVEAFHSTAESRIETRRLWLAFTRLEVRCRAYDPAARLISVSFQAAVADAETGRTGPVDGSLRCQIVDNLGSDD